MEAGPPDTEVDVEGIDRAGVTAWMVETIPGSEPPFTFELIAGGRSNLTYRVTDRSGRAFALRRPPVSHVLPTAHDMKREHTVISALGGTGVPVPRALGLCTDESVNGAPFYVMSFVEGHIVRDERAAGRLAAGRQGACRRVAHRNPGPAPCRGRRRRRASGTSPGATGTSHAS